MGKNCRHFRALMKKNFIIWRRKPICSACELLFPPVIMLILAATRWLIPMEKTDLSSLEKYRHPLFPALAIDQNRRGEYEWAYDREEVNAR